MILKCALQRQEPDLSGYTLGAAFCCDSLDNTEHPASQSRLADPGAGMRCRDKRQQGVVLTEQTVPGACCLKPRTGAQ